MGSTIRCDLAIVGGGLAGGLIALALKARRPALDVRVIDHGATFGGNHLWSFFGSDVAQGDRWIVAPLVAHAWRGYDVAFPGLRRTVDATYYSVPSRRLDRALRQALPRHALMTERRVLAASASAVVLADGDRIEAGGVIDARGPGDLSLLDLGWQKFVGRELTLAAPHGVERPMVMDATVAQTDGYRFVYCLPFTPETMFVEDTYYSDTPDLDREALGARIADYARERGWRAEPGAHADAGHAEAGHGEAGHGEAGHGEAGVLPVAMGGDFEGYWRSGGTGVAKAGMRAGLFHPTTGYSLPDAVRTAAMLVRQSDLSGPALHAATHAMARSAWRARGFYRMLDTLLFRAAEPEERYRVLARFYRLDARLIGRFYAGTSTMADKARVLTGKPPVPIGRAIRALWGAA